MRREKGSAATEWVLLAPLVVLLVGVMVAGARLAWVRVAVADAAHAGARAASVQRSALTGLVRGQEVARANLADVPCGEATVDVDVAGFHVPVGQPADVSVSVRCEVSLADLLVPSLPGSISVPATGTAVLDTHRGRR